MLTLTSISFHPRATAVIHKELGHSAESAGGRLKISTHAPYVFDFERSNTCMVVWCTQNARRGGSSFTRHQPCNNQTVL